MKKWLFLSPRDKPSRINHSLPGEGFLLHNPRGSLATSIPIWTKGAGGLQGAQELLKAPCKNETQTPFGAQLRGQGGKPSLEICVLFESSMEITLPREWHSKTHAKIRGWAEIAGLQT